MVNSPIEIDSNNFWDDSDYFTSTTPVTDKLIMNTEKFLGYKLPKAYIDLIKIKNGGSPVKTCFPTTQPTSWADDHIEIAGIKGLDGQWGIAFGEFNSKDTMEEWDYPLIGVIICECPSAGHDAVMLDYSECGNDGEPKVVHVDVETPDMPKITFLADNFSDFIKGMVNRDEFEDEE